MVLLSKLLVAVFLATLATAQLPNSWWSLALVKRHEFSNPDGTLKPLNCSKYASILPAHVLEECNDNAFVISAVTKGIQRALSTCQVLLKDNKWNCTVFLHQWLLGKSVETTVCREREFVRTLLATAITFDIANECRERHIPNCPCDFSIPFITRTENGTIVGGCGAQFDHASTITKKIMATSTTNKSEDLVIKHNTNAGVVLANDTAIVCRCHGPTGSCSLKTCFRTIYSFTAKTSDVLQKYSGAVRVRLEGMRLTPNQANVASLLRTDIAFTDDSPNFCNRAEGVLGTAGRQCDPFSITASNSCHLLCCQRGHHRRTYLVTKKICDVKIIDDKPTLQCTYQQVTQTGYFCN